ncbi:MAG: 5-(carboxyamino)imidazole ribonucleotide synthase [Actinomycetota bacterium]|nr:5-(carboxyamino)imidazole ribonucleotide synthase [Actinomycetota bacterium]
MIRVGVIGGGQLGRMLALSGYPLDIRVTTLDPGEDTPASQVAPSIRAAYDDLAALETLAAASDVLTFEFENVPVEAVRAVARHTPLYPPASALEAAQDRVAEKTLFEHIGLAVAPYAQVSSLADLAEALERIGTPAILKTRRLGYDGKGQTVIRDPAHAAEAWRMVGEAPSILEAFVPFDVEVSIVGARAEDGATSFYPLVANEHRDGILRVSRPLQDVPDLQGRAEAHAHALMDELDYVGVLAIEFFRTGEDLLGNEFAPRVHNTGHWTIEGAETSQFEQHLRAVAGLPLGSSASVGCSVMANLIGEMPDPAAVAEIAGAHLHTYGKAPRPNRKLGHITVDAADPQTLAARWLQVTALLDE